MENNNKRQGAVRMALADRPLFWNVLFLCIMHKKVKLVCQKDYIVLLFLYELYINNGIAHA